MVEGLKGYSYEDRLRILGLTTLETRFLRAELIEVFKILRGFENLDPERFFRWLEMVLGGGTVLNCSRRGIIWTWGSSSLQAGFVMSGTGWGGGGGIVSAGTVNVFKMRLDHHLRNVREYL